MTLSPEEICHFYKTDVYRVHPKYEVGFIRIDGSSSFHMTVLLGNGYCYYFLIIPDESERPFEEIRPSDDELNQFMQTHISPPCVLKRVIIVKKNSEGIIERRIFDPENIEMEDD